MKELLPIIILGGSDRYRETIPKGLTADDMLSGFKGAVRLPTGRCIAGELVARIRDSGCFLDPILVGPRDAYEGLLDCEVVDVRGNLLATIAAAETIAAGRYGRSHPVAVSACDVLPTAGEFRRLLEEAYEPHAACGLWWQLVAAERAALGASCWKPSYGIAPREGEPAVNVYPGHLLIVRPAALRLEAFNRFLTLAYRYRNRAVYERAIRMTLPALATMMAEDLRILASLHLSGRTFSVPFLAFRAYRKFLAERLTLHDLETVVAKTLVEPDFHRRVEKRSVVFELTRIQSFAKDIDTRAELEELARRIAPGEK
jgi:hypothetical protein